MDNTTIKNYFQSQPVPAIYSSIIGVMDDIGAIGKDKKNSMQGFNYRGIDDVMNALQPALIKNSIFITSELIDTRTEERTTSKGGLMIYRINRYKFHFISGIDGSEITTEALGEASDTSDKASNKSMSVAYKYACFQIFCIPTEEMVDPDSETVEAKAPSKAPAKAQPAKSESQKPANAAAPSNAAETKAESKVAESTTSQPQQQPTAQQATTTQPQQQQPAPAEEPKPPVRGLKSRRGHDYSGPKQ
jgi:type IV secretory pathway VirJ component